MGASKIMDALSSASRTYESYSRSKTDKSAYYDRNDVFDYRDGDTGSTSLIDRGGYGSSGDDCCPLVVDPLTFLGTLMLIGIGTFCLNTYITRNSAPILAAAGGKKRSFDNAVSRPVGHLKLDSFGNKFLDLIWQGEFFFQSKVLSLLRSCDYLYNFSTLIICCAIN